MPLLASCTDNNVRYTKLSKDLIIVYDKDNPSNILCVIDNEEEEKE
jgi:hypothetical protein